MKNSDKILYTFLVESKACTEREFSNLNEDAKVESIRVVAKDLLETIMNLSSSIDTSPIDQSRGDIKSFRWLQDIQTAINQIEEIIDRSKNVMATPMVKEYISTIIRAIFNLNQYSQIFRDAYRTRKSVLILRYQSVLMAVISAVSYLFSAITDFSNNSVALRDNIRIEETSALRTLVQFNKSCETGELKVISTDVNTFREFYNEIPAESMNTILEAQDVFSMVIDGVNNIYKNLDRGGKVTNLIYKGVGIVVALISVREIFNAFARSRYKILDLLNNIKNFTNLSVASLPKLTQFSSRYRADAEENSKIAQRDTIANNKEIITNLKEIPATLPVIPNEAELDKPALKKAATTDDFFF